MNIGYSRHGAGASHRRAAAAPPRRRGQAGRDLHIGHKGLLYLYYSIYFCGFVKHSASVYLHFSFNI